MFTLSAHNSPLIILYEKLFILAFSKLNTLGG
jgi:hypothetical protein